MKQLLVLLAAVSFAASGARGQSGCAGGSCFPSTGNLLVGRGHMLSASSTCGQRGPEPYCIVSHLKDVKKCFRCDASHPRRAHPVQNVITTFDDDVTWWQSESGKQDVIVQLDLEAEFQFTHMIMIFKTFRPAAMLIERSMDFGQTWRTYRYFAYDCDKSFPDVPKWPPNEIDDVICDSRYSLIEPSNGGEVIFRVLAPFIGIDDPYSPRIQNLVKITNLRVNFTELHTLGDDLLDSRPDIKNKYYYALKEMVVRGNCFCYGHADECSPIEGVRKASEAVSRVMVHGRCMCQHNTVGLNCEQCRPFYHDLPWRPAEKGMPNECQPCNCNQHSTSCHFDAAVYAASGQVSGGVCDDCQHFTTGPHCEQCLPFYYAHPGRAPTDQDVCARCECEISGSLDGGVCDGRTDPSLGMIAGQCRCKSNVEGARCDQCKPGYYGLRADDPNGCQACDCDSLGTLSGANTCDPVSGQCICKRYTTGRRCDECLPQTWGMSATPNGCTECDCDIGGAYDDDCDLSTGQCRCRPNLDGRRCDLVESGFFLPGLDYYVFEAEDAEYGAGSHQAKDAREHQPPVTWTGDGFVMVEEGGVVVFIVRDLPRSMNYNLVLRYQSNMPDAWQYVDITIDRPNQGNIPTSSPCGNTRPEDDHWMTSLPGPPATHSSLGVICLEDRYTYRVTVDMRRYQRIRNPEDPTPDILIDSLVVVPVYSDLDMFQGTVEGRQRARQFAELECETGEMFLPKREPHEECAPLLFSMSAVIHDGARACDCDPQGSRSAECDAWGGACRCKPNVIGRRCDRCAPGTYGFGPAGCRPCDCESAGSRDQFCDPVTGQCACEARVTGRRCDRCLPGYYQYPACHGCVCNGHADTCDERTGACEGCRDHTVGEHCDACEVGYYGNPLLGSADQCKPCMCPNGPDSGRQFATGCRKDSFTGRVACFCLKGYAGARCDECAPAYWGNPRDQTGGVCRMCECNGNVDVFDPAACDAGTGVCTACLYDTAGPHCETCREFYYGSALDRSCRSCSCNLLGTERSRCSAEGQCHCDVTTGQCPCLANVAGRNCDQCEPNHWKLASGVGCSACDCNLANSQGPSCNEFTGQCQCNEGFGGRTCDGCADGHFGDPNRECFACDCDASGSTSNRCDGSTGQCPCVPGVGGRRCDSCLRGHTGAVPDCEPCGECFDNWDRIIADLQERTERIVERARTIRQTGITGAYDEEFRMIEKMLDKILEATDTAPQEALQQLLDQINDRLSEQERSLAELEADMTRIGAEDQQVQNDMVQLNSSAQAVQDKLDALRELKKTISKGSPVAAYKQIEDDAQRSAEAELRARASTTEAGSLVEQSRDVREEVGARLDEKQMEFDEKLTQTQMELDEREDDVNALTLSKLNDDVCGRATEGCDDTCGGAGCGTCGGIGCDGVVDFAKDAKDRAQKTQETLVRVADETGDLRSRVQAAKDSAQRAKEAAQGARDRAETVEGEVRQKNSNIRKLIHDIRSFLEEERAHPSEIETYVNRVNELRLPVTRDQIDALAADIRALSDRLPEVDVILNSTEKDLALANRLQQEANQAKAAAQAIAADVDAVTMALAKAENASQRAEAAKNQAETDIELAERKITDIKTTTGVIETTMTDISRALAGFETRLQAVERQIADNTLSLGEAMTEARNSRNLAQRAVDNLAARDGLVENAIATINAKKAHTDRLAALRRSAEALSTQIRDDVGKLEQLAGQFVGYEQELTDKNDELDELLRRVNMLYDQIAELEDYHRTCTT